MGYLENTKKDSEKAQLSSGIPDSGDTILIFHVAGSRLPVNKAESGEARGEERGDGSQDSGIRMQKTGEERCQFPVASQESRERGARIEETGKSKGKIVIGYSLFVDKFRNGGVGIRRQEAGSGRQESGSRM